MQEPDDNPGDVESPGNSKTDKKIKLRQSSRIVSKEEDGNSGNSQKIVARINDTCRNTPVILPLPVQFQNKVILYLQEWKCCKGSRELSVEI